MRPAFMATATSLTTGQTACRTCLSATRLPHRCPLKAYKRLYASAGSTLCLEAEVSRRAWLTTSLVLLASSAQAEDELVIYTNSKNSYSLRRPSDWNQVEKAGADALFKAPDLRSTDLGVTVSPVRIKHLDQLGDVNTVGGRLLAAEKKKESTKSIELLQQSTGIGGSGTEFYEFDYAISTSRGDKRILSKVGVANSKLYIVNASIKCEAEACKDETKLVQLIRQSVQSFDIRT